MKIQVSLDGKVDHLLHPIRLGGFSVDVEFTDAAIVAQRIFFLDEIENGRIVEPGLDVVAHAIGPDEWHDLELGPFCVHELMRAVLGRLVAMMPVMPLRRKTSRTWSSE